jgi:DNA-binding transcriptional LysR family regulator
VNAYPEANVRILHGNPEEMLRHLRHGNVDFVLGLLRDPSPDDLVSEALADTQYVVVARRGHPLHKKAKVTLADLAEYDWVIGTPGASRRARVDELFAGQRGPRARIATSSLPIMRHLLAESDRLTLLTSYELIHDEGDIASAPFGLVEPAPKRGVTTRAGWLATPLHLSFMDMLHQRINASNILVPRKGRASFKLAN